MYEFLPKFKEYLKNRSLLEEINSDYVYLSDTKLRIYDTMEVEMAYCINLLGESNIYYSDLKSYIDNTLYDDKDEMIERISKTLLILNALLNTYSIKSYYIYEDTMITPSELEFISKIEALDRCQLVDIMVKSFGLGLDIPLYSRRHSVRKFKGLSKYNFDLSNENDIKEYAKIMYIVLFNIHTIGDIIEWDDSVWDTEEDDSEF